MVFIDSFVFIANISGLKKLKNVFFEIKLLVSADTVLKS